MLDQGADLRDIGAQFMSSDVFNQRFDGVSIPNIINQLFQNATGSFITAELQSDYIRQLGNQTLTAGELLADIAANSTIYTVVTARIFIGVHHPQVGRSKIAVGII